MEEQAFNPDFALARYRELEALLNLELAKHPEWQRRREQDDYEWLRTHPYFIEQEQVADSLADHGYDITFDEDDVTGKPIYELLKMEDE